MGGFDSLDEAGRSKLMAAIRKRDSKPELLVRRVAHSMGYRFRLHKKGLPGTPDLVFSSRKKVIFVHGCFWHRHSCPSGRKHPKTNLDYWEPKLRRNRARDLKNRQDLASAGWETLVIWECELADLEPVSMRIQQFLDS